MSFRTDLMDSMFKENLVKHICILKNQSERGEDKIVKLADNL